MRKTNTAISLQKIEAALLSIALIQPKTGPRSSGTPFLVDIYFSLVAPEIEGLYL